VDEPATAPLLDILEESGFTSSLITTYNCYFPFFEEVVLRKLVAAGCSHNVLMMDAERCAEALADPELRPRRAGSDYTLIPVGASGVFHPKVLLRLGKSKGSLFVGSHNMTLSGFGLNDEVTNYFHAEGAQVRRTGAMLRVVRDQLREFVPAGVTGLLDAYDGLSHGVPWLEGPLADAQDDRTVLLSLGSGPDLWSRLLPMAPKSVSRAFVSGPFFDHALAFVRRLQRDVEPRELVIGIDPASVELDPSARTLAGVRWGNVSGVAPRKGNRKAPYFHAKLLWFEGKDGELLVSGSANPSAPAFLDVAGRNVEAIVADRRRGAGGALGMDALLAAPTVTDGDWGSVGERWAQRRERSAPPASRVCLATPTDGGFEVTRALPLGLVFDALGVGDEVLGRATVTGSNSVSGAREVCDATRILSGATDGAHWHALVHRPEDIARFIGGATRRRLHQLLGTLEEDPQQLDALLKLTEKVLFDGDGTSITTTQLRAGGDAEDDAPDIAQPESLAADVEGRRSAAKKRSMASGDIGALLQALIRRLGEGLLPTPGQPAKVRPDDADEDARPEDSDSEDIRDLGPLADACQRKVGQLVRRMNRQLELAAQAPGHAVRAVVQLAAVLGVLDVLRRVERRTEWSAKKLQLIDLADLHKLFATSVPLMTWGSGSLVLRAIAEAGGGSFDEISLVVGRLAWLAWDTGIDVPASLNSNAEATPPRELLEAQWFASLTPWVMTDADARLTWEAAVAATSKPKTDSDHWLLSHLELAQRIVEISDGAIGDGSTDRRPARGDLVVLQKSVDPRIRVVLDVESSSGETRVVVYDPRSGNARTSFQASRVASFPWIPEQVARKSTA